MNLHRLVAATAATTLVGGLALAHGFADRRIHVSSDHYRYKSVDLRNRGVRLVRQRSKAPCVQGRTWGYTARKLWVTKGCAGDFAYTERRR